jgi:hypothetical protein
MMYFGMSFSDSYLAGTVNAAAVPSRRRTGPVCRSCTFGRQYFSKALPDFHFEFCQKINPD